MVTVRLAKLSPLLWTTNVGPMAKNISSTHTSSIFVYSKEENKREATKEDDMGGSEEKKEQLVRRHLKII